MKSYANYIQAIQTQKASNGSHYISGTQPVKENHQYGNANVRSVSFHNSKMEDGAGSKANG